MGITYTRYRTSDGKDFEHKAYADAHERQLAINKSIQGALNLGMKLEKEGNHIEAIPLLTNYLNVYGNSNGSSSENRSTSVAYLYRGQAYFNLQQFENAITDLNKAIEYDYKTSDGFSREIGNIIKNMLEQAKAKLEVKAPTGSGTVVPAPVDGTIKEILVNEGDQVSKDTKILTLETSMFMGIDVFSTASGKVHFLAQAGSSLKENQPIAEIC